MAKKQKKLQPKELPSQFISLQSKQLTVVLRNKTSIFGVIEKFDEHIFVMKDAMRHKLTIDLQDVEEVWVDEKVL